MYFLFNAINRQDFLKVLLHELPIRVKSKRGGSKQANELKFNIPLIYLKLIKNSFSKIQQNNFNKSTHRRTLSVIIVQIFVTVDQFLNFRGRHVVTPNSFLSLHYQNSAQQNQTQQSEVHFDYLRF